MSNESQRRAELKKLVLCTSCAGIQRNWRKAPGHAELVQGASRKAERNDQGGGSHMVTLTSYRCDACGARWEYENDKTNQQAGWSLVGQ